MGCISNKYIFPCITLVLMFIFLIISVIDIQDTMTTWILESLAVIVALIILPLTMKKFRLTNLVYFLILLHSMILVYGAHYSYSEVPLGYWLKDIFGGKRNNYDKIGHFMQGFGPVMIAREIIKRRTPLKKGGYLAFLSWCVAMTITALYEIGEWVTSLILTGAADSFLGTQGYIWDTQSDMAMCMIGSIIALILLSHLQDIEISKIEEEEEKEKEKSFITNTV